MSVTQSTIFVLEHFGLRGSDFSASCGRFPLCFWEQFFAEAECNPNVFGLGYFL